MKKLLLTTILAAVCTTSPMSAQFGEIETRKWYFGLNAGLDFMTNPPTVLTNGAMQTLEGCATVSDANGNLLFYTNGVDIWNKTHTLMANGSGLDGNISSSQSSIIVRKPGSSNLYYVFTNSGPWGPGGGYSIVDMSLAAGMGSVTIKNVLLTDTTTEKLTSVRHCNGVDVWVIFHRWFSTEFRAYLLTASGINPVPVISSIGSWHGTDVNQDYAGCMKTSPNGKKLGLGILGAGIFELFDFDNTTGVLSNSLSLTSSQIIPYAYGCEFSPDGTKFYGSTAYAPGSLYQWDLCAGSNSAIVASKTLIHVSNKGLSTMQNAANGKIYIARFQNNILGIIHNPNGLGTSCNYVDAGLSIAPKSTIWSLPNFISSSLKPGSPPVTFSTSCLSTSFSAPAQTTGTNCQSATFSLTSLVWDFGDPASGAANTSTVINPIHVFSGLGTYSTQLIMYYSCGGGTDTLRKVVTISTAGPVLAVSGTYTVCSGDKRVYTASGADTYSWNTGVQTPSISVTHTTTSSATVVYTVTGTNTTNSCSATQTISVLVDNCTSILSNIDWLVDVYPNPVGDVLYINSATNGSATLTDVQGRILLEVGLTPGEQHVKLGGIENGVYFLKIGSDAGWSVRRIVKW